MFGKNPLRKPDYTSGDKLAVKEHFLTIQGEGPHAGKRAYFIRLWGCHLRCYFCDTDFEGTHWDKNVEALTHDVVESGAELVVFTGGEPLRQDVVPATRALLDRGINVQFETTGTLCPPDMLNMLVFGSQFEGKADFVISPKTGTVTEHFRTFSDLFGNVSFKYIVSEREGVDEDGLPRMSTQNRGKKARIARPLKDCPVYLQPMDEYSPTQNRKNHHLVAELCVKHGYRMSVQMHKLADMQ